MRHRLRSIALALVVVPLVGCAAGPGSGGGGSPGPAAAAASYKEFHDHACAAWDALFRAIGNPDTGSGSDLSKAFDTAIARRDVAGADDLAARMRTELETGRRDIAIAAGWAPASPVMRQMDRLFIAFEASVEAKRAAAARGDSDPAAAGQAALERAGGLAAWSALLGGADLDAARQAIASARPAGDDGSCPNVPVSM